MRWIGACRPAAQNVSGGDAQIAQMLLSYSASATGESLGLAYQVKPKWPMP
jgi:hypothetical protein